MDYAIMKDEFPKLCTSYNLRISNLKKLIDSEPRML